jgi:hypothetical protein
MRPSSEDRNAMIRAAQKGKVRAFVAREVLPRLQKPRAASKQAA